MAVQLNHTIVAASDRWASARFLVTEEEFDDVLGRIRARALPYWADPFDRHPGETNRNDGGRGVYWKDPDGHVLEIITRPYGG